MYVHTILSTYKKGLCLLPVYEKEIFWFVDIKCNSVLAVKMLKGTLLSLASLISSDNGAAYYRYMKRKFLVCGFKYSSVLLIKMLKSTLLSLASQISSDNEHDHFHSEGKQNKRSQRTELRAGIKNN